MPARTNLTSKISIRTTAVLAAVVAVVLTSIAFPLARADQPAPRRSAVSGWWHNQTRMYMNRRRASAKPATAARQAAPAKVPTVVKQPVPLPETRQTPNRLARRTPTPVPVLRKSPTPNRLTRRTSTPVPVLRKSPPPTRRRSQTPKTQRVPRPAIRQVVAQAPRVPANQPPSAPPATAGFARLSAPLYPAPVQNIPHQVGGVVITNPALAPHEMLYEHEYRALYPPFYYRVKGWWAWTPFGVESHDKWELIGTEVRVRYKSRPSLLQRLADPFIDPFID